MGICLETIQEIVRNIWETILGWDIQPAPALDVPLGNRDFQTSYIQVAGAWEGTVVCIGSEVLIRQAAAVMFKMPQDAVTIELKRDALGELTNMIGGNLKALLPGPSFLCLPAVIEGSYYSVCVPSTRSVIEAGFSCQGQPFMVKLLSVG